MAEQLPNLYTFGQVKVDTSSLADLQGKLFAKQQAKQEALDKYFEKQMSSLKREGIATNDVTDYEKELAATKDYWKENSSEIKKGGAAKIEFDNKMQGLRDFIVESKDKKNNSLEYRKQYQFGGKTPTDNDIQILEYMELPIRDPRRINPATGRPWGIADLSVQVPLFDLSKRKSFFSAIEGNVPRAVKKKKGDPYSIGGGQKEQVFEEYYSDAQLKDFENKAAQAINTDKVAKNYYETILANPNDPANAKILARLQQAWDESKLHVGKKMETVEDLVKADVLTQFFLSPPLITREKTYSVQRSSGRGTPSGPGDTWDDYFIISKYTPVAIPGTNKQGVKATSVSSAQREVIKRLGLTPAIINNEDWYISGGPKRWEDDLGNYITDDDIANATAPAELKRAQKGGTNKPKIGSY